MRFDLAVVGAPFLDLTFEGLPRLPGLGEEVMARSLHLAPGGTGMQAIGAARLGLATALVAPIARDGVGGLVRGFLESDGVEIVSRASGRGEEKGWEVPVTSLLATSEGVAMATALQGREPTAEEIACVPARAVVVSLGRLPLAPPDGWVYAVTGGLELPDRAGKSGPGLVRRARALIVNEAEAASLTGRLDPKEAGLELARCADTVAITMGRAGVFGVEKERAAFAPTPDVEVRDATGAGDLFAVAYVWADLHGAALEDRLAWASLYAGLSVRAPTAHAGAVNLDELLAEGISIGLTPPETPPSACQT